MDKKKVVVLLSGGLDSATLLGIAKNRGHEIYVLSFDYGQKAGKEIESAKKLSRFYDVKKHLILNIELEKIGGSALTDKDIEIPKERDFEGIPITYVPSRNIIFLSFGASFAEVVGAQSILIGANCIDYSGYPDCRPSFFEKFEKMLVAGTKGGVEGKMIKIETPLIHKT